MVETEWYWRVFVIHGGCGVRYAIIVRCLVVHTINGSVLHFISRFSYIPGTSLDDDSHNHSATSL